METMIKITKIDNFNFSLFRTILEKMNDNFGELEIIVRPKKSINKRIEKDISEVENGSEMLYFSSADFEKLNKQLLSNQEIDINTIKKVRQDEKGNIIYC